MRILVDANISYRIKRKLRGAFPNIEHVDNAGLAVPPSDIEIWKFALENDYAILTFDEDFYNLSIINGSPPKVIWLRFGNVSSNTLATILLRHKKAIQLFLSDTELGLLELYR